MRLPIEPLTPIEPGKAADLYELREVSALTATRRVTERTLPPLVSHPRPPAPKAGARDQAASGPVEPEHDERRGGGDRRQVCRRVGRQGEDLFDTRSESDRRKGPRRAGDRPSHIDEEV